jgi:hypothetical protein
VVMVSPRTGEDAASIGVLIEAEARPDSLTPNQNPESSDKHEEGELSRVLHRSSPSFHLVSAPVSDGYRDLPAPMTEADRSPQVRSAARAARLARRGLVIVRFAEPEKRSLLGFTRLDRSVRATWERVQYEVSFLRSYCCVHE